MSPYNRNPPARERVFADRVLPPRPMRLVWPVIAQFVCPPVQAGREGEAGGAATPPAAAPKVPDAD